MQFLLIFNTHDNKDCFVDLLRNFCENNRKEVKGGERKVFVFGFKFVSSDILI